MQVACRDFKRFSFAPNLNANAPTGPEHAMDVIFCRAPPLSCLVSPLSFPLLFFFSRWIRPPPLCSFLHSNPGGLSVSRVFAFCFSPFPLISAIDGKYRLAPLLRPFAISLLRGLVDFASLFFAMPDVRTYLSAVLLSCPSIFCLLMITFWLYTPFSAGGSDSVRLRPPVFL